MADDEDYQDNEEAYGQTYDGNADFSVKYSKLKKYAERTERTERDKLKKETTKKGIAEPEVSPKDEPIPLGEPEEEDIEIVGRGDTGTTTTEPKNRSADPAQIAEFEFKTQFNEICNKDGEYERALEIIRKLDNFINLNMRLLSLAAYFYSLYGNDKNLGVNSVNIEKFVKVHVREKTEEKRNNAILDIIRYIRLYTSVIKLRS